MSNNILRLGVKGDVLFEDITPGDELGVILDKQNAIHPQNMARVIARALANEPNSSIYKLALGNGGTFVDATGEIAYRLPRDGILPDTAGWQSRLYEETYYEYVDESAANLGYGTGSDPSSDGVGVGGVRSIALPTGESQVIVTMILNKNEPVNQVSSSLTPDTSFKNGDFVFDELGLFTRGRPLYATQGYQDVNVGVKIATDQTNLLPGTYTFDVIRGTWDNPTDQAANTKTVTITVTSATYSYLDLVNALNDPLNPLSAASQGMVVQVTPLLRTYGSLRVISTELGDNSRISIVQPTVIPPNWLFTNLRNGSALGSPSSFVGLKNPVQGQDAGVEDNSVFPNTECERMLTHLIFSPIQKAADRVWKITYKLTVVVQQSDPVV